MSSETCSSPTVVCSTTGTTTTMVYSTAGEGPEPHEAPQLSEHNLKRYEESLRPPCDCLTTYLTRVERDKAEARKRAKSQSKSARATAVTRSTGRTSYETVLETQSDVQHRHDQSSSSSSHIKSHFSTDDEEHPRNWVLRRKIAIAIFVLWSSFVAGIGTPIFIAVIPSISTSWNISNATLETLPASLYPFGLGVGALLATAGSEVFGRKIVYQITVPLSLALTIMGGVAKNYVTLCVARSFAGLFSGPCLTVGAGIFNDLWDTSLEKLGTLFAVLFVVFLIWATQLGPMVSGAILTDRSWRWTFWVSCILIGVTLIGAFMIPETYHPQILLNKAKAEKWESPNRHPIKMFLIAVGRPLHMTFVEPIVFPVGLVLAITQSIVFAYYVAYAILFENVYGFTPYKVGLAFGPLAVGSLLAIPVIGIFDKVTYQPKRLVALKSGTLVDPEYRLYPAMLGSFTLPASLFWLAWTGKPNVHWIVPLLSGGLFGLSYVLNMLCLPVYNNDIYSTALGASVLASSTFIRFTISSCFPIFTAQMITKLNFSWAVTLLGFITMAMIPVPWVFFKWGPKLRRRGPYTKLGDAGWEGNMFNIQNSSSDGSSGERTGEEKEEI